MPNKSRYRRSAGHRKNRFGRPQLAMLLLVVAIAAVVAERFSACGHTTAGNIDVDTACLTKTVIPDGQAEVIVPYTGFTVSFNPEQHIPNYVAWELTATEAEGSQPRESKFFQDTDVPGCPATDDYRRSGFDRGHMAPAADMKWNAQAMHDSHSLANICPQDHSLNSGRWSTLEKTCRQWAKRDSAIIIICGPVMTDAMPQTIGQAQVRVPRRFFKVILAPYADPVRAIGFIMPNSYTDEGLEELACSVDDIEAATGYDFFACLPDSIEAQIESRPDFRAWTKGKTKRK